MFLHVEYVDMGSSFSYDQAEALGGFLVHPLRLMYLVWLTGMGLRRQYRQGHVEQGRSQ